MNFKKQFYVSRNIQRKSIIMDFGFFVRNLIVPRPDTGNPDWQIAKTFLDKERRIWYIGQDIMSANISHYDPNKEYKFKEFDTNIKSRFFIRLKTENKIKINKIEDLRIISTNEKLNKTKQMKTENQTRNLTIIVKGGTNTNNITIDNKNSDKAMETLEAIVKSKTIEQEMQKESMNLIREIVKDLKETVLKLNTKKTKKSSKK